MDRIDTDAPHEPAVYVTRDLSRVFVQTWDALEGVHIHQADDTEVERLWHAYRIGPLLGVLALMGRNPGPNSTGPGRHQPTRS